MRGTFYTGRERVYLFCVCGGGIEEVYHLHWQGLLVKRPAAMQIKIVNEGV